MEEDLYYAGQRRRLTDTIQEKGISDQQVLEAIGSVPRHLFFDPSFKHHAYEDKAFPIGEEQTISQPYTVARQTELLDLDKNMKVLEIGTGSGYQCAVLLKMQAIVYTIERQRKLYKQLQRKLPKLGYRPKKLIFGDGYLGLPDEAPFDRIIVTAGAEEVPSKLLSQLAIGGKMVIPVGKETQTMYVITRNGQTDFSRKDYGKFRFVPMLEDKA